MEPRFAANRLNYALKKCHLRLNAERCFDISTFFWCKTLALNASDAVNVAGARMRMDEMGR